MKNKSAKKKQVKKKRRLNIKRVFVLLCLIALLILIFKGLSLVNVSKVEISGNNYVKESLILKTSGLNEPTSYFGLSKKEVCDKIKTIAMVNTCEIRKNFGFKIDIIITENRPLFFYLNTNKLVLSNKKQIEDTNVYGVPNLINYVPEEILNKFISGLEYVKSDIIQGTSEIEYTPSQNSDGTYIDAERFMLSMKDGNIVYINIRNIKVLDSYDKIYASLGDKKGIYNLDSDYGNYYIEEFDKKENE